MSSCQKKVRKKSFNEHIIYAYLSLVNFKQRAYLNWHSTAEVDINKKLETTEKIIHIVLIISEIYC